MKEIYTNYRAKSDSLQGKLAARCGMSRDFCSKRRCVFFGISQPTSVYSPSKFPLFKNLKKK